MRKLLLGFLLIFSSVLLMAQDEKVYTSIPISGLIHRV